MYSSRLVVDGKVHCFKSIAKGKSIIPDLLRNEIGQGIINSDLVNKKVK